jgi:hypothetical protein
MREDVGRQIGLSARKVQVCCSSYKHYTMLTCLKSQIWFQVSFSRICVLLPFNLIN